MRMEGHGMGYGSSSIIQYSEEEMDLRRGPWTVEEDLVLVSYIANHGEGRWNSLARSAGLKRTGKSCRLRWLNYLRPDVRRGNITPEEQLLILELHSRWGNRWSKIAQYLPGRTDNEIKNYWRTRVLKEARQLQCDVNSKRFEDVVRGLWVPRLLEKIQAASGGSSNHTATATTAAPPHWVHPVDEYQRMDVNPSPESSSSMAGSSSDSLVTPLSSPPVSDFTANCHDYTGESRRCSGESIPAAQLPAFPGSFLCGTNYPGSLHSPRAYFNQGLTDFDQSCWVGADMSENLWNADDIWLLQQQL